MLEACLEDAVGIIMWPAAPDKTRNQTDHWSPGPWTCTPLTRWAAICETRMTLSARPKGSRFPVTVAALRETTSRAPPRGNRRISQIGDGVEGRLGCVNYIISELKEKQTSTQSETKR